MKGSKWEGYLRIKVIRIEKHLFALPFRYKLYRLKASLQDDGAGKIRIEF